MADTTALSDQTAKLLEDLRTMLEKGGQFVLEQAPPLAREVVAFGRATETMYVVLAIAGLTLAIYKLAKNGKRWFDASDDAPHGGFLLFVPMTIVSALTFLFSINDCLMAWAAPRLYLLKYVAHAIHGGCH